MRQSSWLNQNATYRRIQAPCSGSLKGPLNLHHHHRPLAGRHRAWQIMGGNAADLERAQTQNACAPGSHADCLQSFLPMAVLTDSYKANHYLQYPSSQQMQAYAEFRTGFDKDKDDARLIFFGLRYILENFVSRQWTQADVTKAALFFKSHMAPAFSEFPFPEHLFLKFVNENNGHFPVKLEALPEGTVVHAHVPVYQITSQGEYAPLCTFLETMLTMLWYPSTVATHSRRARDVIEAAFERSVDGGRDSPLLGSRLHDFGFRGCTCLEQSVLGGVAHLLNFEGTDTLSAAYYAQFHLNGGHPVAMSIPATEHSVMTSWRTEQAAMENMMEQFGTGLYAIVMDSYDYAEALSSLLPAVAEKKLDKGGFLVLRPDSGNPVEVVLMALEAAVKVFGADRNSKGFLVPRGCGVIQGDGIGLKTIAEILDAVVTKGYSAQAVAFGMGGGLLQRVNRDTMSFATKLCHITYEDGTSADIMKLPKSDLSKYSLPGAMAVKRVDGVPTAFPADGGHVAPEENMLKVCWDKGPVKINLPCPVAMTIMCGPGQAGFLQMEWEMFSSLKQRVAREWRELPPTADVLSQPLKEKIKEVTSRMGRADIFE